MDGLCNGPGEEEIAIAMLYCDFRDQQEQKTTNITGAILKQLVGRDQVLEGMQYASRYWGKHIRREKTEYVNPLSLELLIGFEQHISSPLLLESWHIIMMVNRGGAVFMRGICLIALRSSMEPQFLGLSRQFRPSYRWRYGILTPQIFCVERLIWAAVWRHEEVVRIFLQLKDINPSTTDTQYDRTPLLRAVERGNDGVVNLLL